MLSWHPDIVTRSRPAIQREIRHAFVSRFSAHVLSSVVSSLPTWSGVDTKLRHRVSPQVRRGVRQRQGQEAKTEPAANAFARKTNGKSLPIAKGPQSKSASPDELLDQGNTAYEKRQYDKAIQLFGQLIKLRPKSPVAFYRRGLARAGRNFNFSADPRFQRGDSIEARLSRGIPGTRRGEKGQQQI